MSSSRAGVSCSPARRKATDAITTIRPARRKSPASTRAQQLRRLGDCLGLDPEDRGETAAGGHRIHRDDVDLRRGQRLECPGHRADAVVALKQEAALLLRYLELELLRRARERGGALRHEVELPLALAGEAGKRKQVDTMLGEARQHLRTLSGG